MALRNICKKYNSSWKYSISKTSSPTFQNPGVFVPQNMLRETFQAKQ